MRSVTGRKMWLPNSHSAANSDLWIPFQIQLSCYQNNILQAGYCFANMTCRFRIGILSLQLNCSYANYDLFLCACGTVFQNRLQHFFFPWHTKSLKKKYPKIQAEFYVSSCNLSWFCRAYSKWSSSINKFLLMIKGKNLLKNLEEGIKWYSAKKYRCKICRLRFDSILILKK